MNTHSERSYRLSRRGNRANQNVVFSTDVEESPSVKAGFFKHCIKFVTVSIGLGLFLWAVPMGSPAWAGVDVNINVGVPLPPAIVVEAPPTMVFLPEPAVYVAIGVPYDIFFISGRYYYLYGGNWFWAPGYGGPWVHVVYRSLPPGLRKYKVERLRVFREREFKLSKEQGPKYKGRHFMAISGPNQKAKEAGPGGPIKHGRGFRK